MKCGDCHVTDRSSPEGALLPVTFEQNCKSCHARELEFDVYHVLGPDAAPAPHTRDPKTIREFIVAAYRGKAGLRDRARCATPKHSCSSASAVTATREAIPSAPALKGVQGRYPSRQPVARARRVRSSGASRRGVRIVPRGGADEHENGGRADPEDGELPAVSRRFARGARPLRSVPRVSQSGAGKRRRTQIRRDAVTATGQVAWWGATDRGAVAREQRRRLGRGGVAARRDPRGRHGRGELRRSRVGADHRRGCRISAEPGGRARGRGAREGGHPRRQPAGARRRARAHRVRRAWAPPSCWRCGVCRSW